MIGLDIGVSAVRAARVVAGGRRGLRLVSFGQAALPPGAVVDGEVRDAGAVSETIAQLWKRTKPGSKKAVIGVANQRVVVRQIDLPFLEEKEFRSSLRFQVADHIPMPVESAELDYQIIDDYVDDEGQHMMRVLLVAAASEMVESFVAAAAAANIDPVGVDLTPFAVARAVSPAARGEIGAAGAEAIIDIGATVTNIVVHHNGEPRFVRILLVGGDNATARLADQLGLELEEAEALKIDVAAGAGPGPAQPIIEETVRRIVREVRGSLDYYLSQEGSEAISSVILTGGGSLTPGLLEALQSTLGGVVRPGAAMSEMDVRKSGLTGDQISQAEPLAAAAIGLAQGGGRRG